MKTTFYITESDSHGWSAILRGYWDTTKPIAEASVNWETVGVVNSDRELEHFVGSSADGETLEICQPLKPGTTITVEDE